MQYVSAAQGQLYSGYYGRIVIIRSVIRFSKLERQAATTSKKIPYLTWLLYDRKIQTHHPVNLSRSMLSKNIMTWISDLRRFDGLNERNDDFIVKCSSKLCCVFMAALRIPVETACHLNGSFHLVYKSCQSIITANFCLQQFSGKDLLLKFAISQ